MAPPKSFLPRLVVDQALRAHNCQHNRAHRILQGNKRLKVVDGRTTEHFCVHCAVKFLEGDIAEMQQLTIDLKVSGQS